MAHASHLADKSTANSWRCARRENTKGGWISAPDVFPFAAAEVTWDFLACTELKLTKWMWSYITDLIRQYHQTLRFNSLIKSSKTNFCLTIMQVIPLIFVA